MDKEWEKFGRDIRAIVEDAVNTQDFRQLNKTITNTINEAVNSIQDGLKTAGDAVNQAVSQSFSENRNQKEWQEKNPKNQYGHFSQSFSENPGERGWKERNHKNQYGHFSQSFSENRSGREWQEKNPNTKPELFKKNTSVKVGGIVLTACGWTFGVGFGIAVVVLMLVGMFLGSFNFVPFSCRVRHYGMEREWHAVCLEKIPGVYCRAAWKDLLQYQGIGGKKWKILSFCVEGCKKND